ncbi:TPA_asm: P3 [Chrysanthemum alphacytorhabdovirus 1]|nr:TPA_asm: P3 [Chrysanthemum alphacytorhabdovirus 1]
MESRMTIISGEFATSDNEGVISLSKKIGVFNKILVKLGYTNIAIKQVLFKYKSRCSHKATGVMNLRLLDRRMEDPDEQYIDGLRFNITDWINFSWSYPCWFHYKDFETKEGDLLEIEWDVTGSNVVDHVSLGHYKVKIVYQMQNDITMLKPMKNVAMKTHSQEKPEAFVRKGKKQYVTRSAANLLNISETTPTRDDPNNQAETRKSELLQRSMDSLFPQRGRLLV